MTYHEFESSVAGVLRRRADSIAIDSGLHRIADKVPTPQPIEPARPRFALARVAAAATLVVGLGAGYIVVADSTDDAAVVGPNAPGDGSDPSVDGTDISEFDLYVWMTPEADGPQLDAVRTLLESSTAINSFAFVDHDDAPEEPSVDGIDAEMPSGSYRLAFRVGMSFEPLRGELEVMAGVARVAIAPIVGCTSPTGQLLYQLPTIIPADMT